MPSSKSKCVEGNDAHQDGVSRRKFIGTTTAGLALGTHLFLPSISAGTISHNSGMENIRRMLGAAVLQKDTIDRFLDPKARVWAKFHPNYGYLLRNTFMRDGVDGCHTLARYDHEGYRHQVNFPDQPCRINSYGDSFTQGHQVSDGETWQEVLAAHFCEPIRNYGIGGFGVFQAYQRLREIEETELQSPFLIFNIWGDDHLRSISPWRWLTFPKDVMESMGSEMFHANPWDHARLDPQSGALLKISSACPTPESLYSLCDRDFVVDTFQEDEVVHAMAAIRTGVVADAEPLERMASAINFGDLDFSNSETTKNSVNHLYHAYAVGVGIKIMEELNDFVRSRDKKLMVLLSYPSGSVWHHCSNKFDERGYVDWHPDNFVQFLVSQQIPYVNTIEKHVAEFKSFSMSADAYVQRYYIGHYNPTGNHFFAYAVKNEILEWLDPKPPSYLSVNDLPISFEGYLPS